MSKRSDTVRGFSAAIAARMTLLRTSGVESAVLACLVEAAAKVGMVLRRWDVCAGFTEQAIEGGRLVWRAVPGAPSASQAGADPGEALAFIGRDRTPAVYALLDFACWVERDAVARRQLRNVAVQISEAPSSEVRSIVLVGADTEIHADIKAVSSVLEFPLPDRGEIAAILGTVLASNPQIKIDDQTREKAIDAAVGLTADGASKAYSLSIVLKRTIDVRSIADEKKRAIRDSGLLWLEPIRGGLAAVGGLAFLKAWLSIAYAASGQAARAFGLPMPRGMFLAGVSGCGKSLIARACGEAFACPVLRLDLGGLQSKYVGESQGNLRRALSVAEAISPCVLLIDEVEKALAGSQGAQGDGGVSADALGELLTWLNDKVAPVFVVATANDIRRLPPELTRKGRFDEVFFVDLPGATERGEIVAAALRALPVPRDPASVDLAAVADASVGFNGAEVATLAGVALGAAFERGARAVGGEGDLCTADLMAAARTVVPLSRTRATDIAELRAWASTNARPANAPEAVRAAPTMGSVPVGGVISLD